MTEETMNNGFGGGYKALSVIGTVLGGLGVLGEGSSLLGMGLNRNASADYVTKENLEMSMRISQLESEKALLESSLNTEVKIVDTYKALTSQINNLEKEQSAVNRAQAVTNCAVTSNLAVANNNIAQLMSMTRMYIPSERVTPKPMPEFNSWTAPTT